MMFTENFNNYVVTSTLPHEFGGRTKSLLERTKNLSKKFGLKFTIITTNYQPNYYKTYQKYYEKNYVNEKVDFLNIYDYFSGRNYENRKLVKHPLEIRGYDCCEIDKEQTYRYFKNGYYELYRSYDKKTGNLEFEDIMDIYSRKRKERLEYNNFGICHKKIIYKSNTINKLEEIFYDDNGEVYLIINYSGADNNKLVRVYLLQQNNMIMFKTEKDFFQYAFDQILHAGGVTFCDARLLDKPLLNSVVNTKKYFVLHNSHNIGGVFRESYKYIIENADKATMIIVLTHEQLNDLLELGVNHERLTVIPHSMDDDERDVCSHKPERKFIYLGRLVPEKQIPHIITAFKKVIEKYPEYSLEIYGDGEEAEKIFQLIGEMQINDNVKMMGRTEDIPGVFQSGIASIIASDYEGFGLVVMESLHYGCPVISYDFKYGPRDLIEDGKNGYIIEKNNIDMLADTMIKMINNPIADVKLSNDYYLSSTIRKWDNLINQR